jgi:hypothetical protein
MVFTFFYLNFLLGCSSKAYPAKKRAKEKPSAHQPNSSKISVSGKTDLIMIVLF